MRLLLAVMAVSTPMSCGLLMGGSEQAEERPGVALLALKREVGVGSTLGDSGGSTSSPELEVELDAATRMAWMREQASAEEMLGEIYRRTGRLDPDQLPETGSRPARLARAMCLLRLGTTAESANILAAILEQEPRYFPAWMALAGVRAAEQRLDASLRFYRKVLLLAPEMEACRRELAMTLLRSKKAEEVAEGRRILRELMKKGEQPAEAAMDLAEWLVRERRLREAEETLRSVMQRGSARVTRFLADVLRQEGRFADALALLDPLSSIPSRMQGALLYECLVNERSLGRFEAALKRHAVLAGEAFAGFRAAFGQERFQLLGEDLRHEQKAGKRLFYPPSELLILVRRGASPAQRHEAMDTLLGMLVRGASARLRRRVLDTIEEVMREDPDPTTRALAMLRLQGLQPDNPAPLGQALLDPDPRVRRKAAEALGSFSAERVGALLLAALLREKDSKAFRQMHETLLGISGRSEYLEEGAEEDPERRDEIREQWRLRFRRERGEEGKENGGA
ncbi:MAG: HEAT repeat domain-containing protein [Planctomycetota bacterium]